MVELDCLAAFDCLQWLRTGERAAQVVGCSQSTISRSTRKCQDTFQIKIAKREAEWQVQGDATLLNAERRVHQVYRWSSGRPLRLESQHWLRSSYADLNLRGWIQGNFNYLEYARPLQLLHERVIDAWLCSAPDLPQSDDVSSIQLCRMPALLVARRSHPLLQGGANVTLENARRYPVDPLPAGAFPVFESMMTRLGFHNDFSTLATMAEQDGRDPRSCEDLALAIASPLTVAAYGDDWAVLPLELPIVVGDALIVQTDFVDHPRTQELVQQLSRRLRTVVGADASVQLLSERPLGQRA